MPVAPSNSSNPMYQMKRMMVLAAALSVMMLSVMSFFRNAVRSENEVRKKLDCNFLGEIPHEKKHKTLQAMLSRRKSSILLTSPLTSFHFVESIRKLRRRVEQYMNGGKVLMVTSLLENEGKSTVAVNLALALAQKHGRVLLIDSDTRKPACHAILEQKKFAHGVREVLRKEAAVAEALVRYRKTNMYMLLEKKGNTKSADLITSAEMAKLLEWARGEFDYIVLDLPPIVAGSDTESMKELADASILVVRQNVATAKAINKAVADMDDGRAKLIGCVLNNVHSTRLTSGQGHRYGSYDRYRYYTAKG
jgi:capsular exopolysaccharide synthesis family protein